MHFNAYHVRSRMLGVENMILAVFDTTRLYYGIKHMQYHCTTSGQYMYLPASHHFLAAYSNCCETQADTENADEVPTHYLLTHKHLSTLCLC